MVSESPFSSRALVGDLALNCLMISQEVRQEGKVKTENEAERWPTPEEPLTQGAVELLQAWSQDPTSAVTHPSC